VREAQVPNELEGLAVATQELRNELEALIKRLSTVSTPMPPVAMPNAAGTATAPRPVLVSVAEQVMTQRQIVQDCVQTVRGISARLEV
jgi:hypothetical protein